MRSSLVRVLKNHLRAGQTYLLGLVGQCLREPKTPEVFNVIDVLMHFQKQFGGHLLGIHLLAYSWLVTLGC